MLSFSLLTSLSMMPQWNPTTIEEVKNEDIDRVFQQFSSEQELQVPSDDSNRWAVTYLKSPSPTSLMDPT